MLLLFLNSFIFFLTFFADTLTTVDERMLTAERSVDGIFMGKWTQQGFFKCPTIH